MKNGFFRNIRVKRVLLYCFAAGAAALVLLVAFIASLPVIVSSPTVQAHLKQSLVKSLHRPVGWSRLTLTWTRGLTLAGLSLGDGPPPLLRAGVDEVVIVPAFSLGQDRRLKVDLSLSVRAVDANLAPGPPKPPKPYKEPLTALAQEIHTTVRRHWMSQYDQTGAPRSQITTGTHARHFEKRNSSGAVIADNTIDAPKRPASQRRIRTRQVGV